MGRTIRASFGTTKYCNSFLRNLPCNNPECLYLHELGDEGDRFTKDEVQLGLARHGSSFAFKEEVVGDRGGSSSGHGRRGGGAGDGGGSSSAQPRPTNPVLPPPCPTTPPSHGGRQGGVNAGASPAAHAGGKGGPISAPLPQLSPPSCQAGRAAENGHGIVGGYIGHGGDARWAGGQPGSPLPIGADGRPRPRRRRGQRGRRGGNGGNGSGSGSNCATGVNGGGGGGSGCCVVGSGGQAEGLAGSPIDCGHGGGDCVSTPAPALSSSAHTARHEYGQALAGNNPDSVVSQQRLRVDVCAPGMRTSGCSGAFDSGGGGNSYGGSGGTSGGELYHPAPKLGATWGGSDRSSVSSCLSVGGGSSYSGGGGGRGYWGGQGRVSPLATPESLTDTPPADFTPSSLSSPPTAFRSGLGGVSTAQQGLWNLQGFGGQVGNPNSGGGERDNDGPDRPITGGVYAHRHIKIRPVPAFVGLGDGEQAPSGQKQHQRQSSRGADLASISEFHQIDRQDRGRSLDLRLEQLCLDGERRSRCRPQQQWSGAVGEHAAAQAHRQQCFNGDKNSGGGGGDGGGASLFAQRFSPNNPSLSTSTETRDLVGALSEDNLYTRQGGRGILDELKGSSAANNSAASTGSPLPRLTLQDGNGSGRHSRSVDYSGSGDCVATLGSEWPPELSLPWGNAAAAAAGLEQAWAAEDEEDTLTTPTLATSFDPFAAAAEASQAEVKKNMCFGCRKNWRLVC